MAPETPGVGLVSAGSGGEPPLLAPTHGPAPALCSWGRWGVGRGSVEGETSLHGENNMDLGAVWKSGHVVRENLERFIPELADKAAKLELREAVEERLGRTAGTRGLLSRGARRGERDAAPAPGQGEEGETCLR